MTPEQLKSIANHIDREFLEYVQSELEKDYMRCFAAAEDTQQRGYYAERYSVASEAIEDIQAIIDNLKG